MTRVTLSVSIPVCRDGVELFVAGNCLELGNWTPQAAKPMTRISSADSVDVWATSVDVSVAHLEYRYFTACVLQSFNCPSAGNCRCTVAVQDWEAGKKPRMLELTGASVNCDKDVYGVYNGERNVSRGWLTGQSEICLRVHGQAVWLESDSALQAHYRIKCDPVDMWPNSETVCANHCRFGPVLVATSSGDKLLHQTAIGISFSATIEHITFKVQTCSLEMMAFKFFLYHDSSDGSCSKVTEIGVAFYQIGTGSKSHAANIPVISSTNGIVGTLRVDSVVVDPIKNFPADLNFSPLLWSMPHRSLTVGHRGLGKTFIKGLSSARVPENTVRSFSETAKSGADMVEFDVMLTSDKVPVIFHDFMASVNVTGADGERSRSLTVPVTDLTLEQLSTLNVTKRQDQVVSGMNGREDERPFPTLKCCFEAVDPHLRFNIEIKYCMHLLSTGQYEEGVQHFPERNSYVDVILSDIFRHAGDREIILSCFDPDVCTMLCAKQTRYPVAFLSQGETGRYETFQDSRAATLQMAVNFATAESLTAVVLNTEGLLKDIRLIELGHSCGLSVFCWGEDNNDIDTIKLLRKHMVDGVICDRVDELMQALNMDQGQ